MFLSPSFEQITRVDYCLTILRVLQSRAVEVNVTASRSLVTHVSKPIWHIHCMGPQL